MPDNRCGSFAQPFGTRQFGCHGFTACWPVHSSKCRCGLVERPVLPESAMRSPRFTFRPGFTSSFCSAYSVWCTDDRGGSPIARCAAAFGDHSLTVADRQHRRAGPAWRNRRLCGATRPVTGFTRRGLKLEEMRNCFMVGKRMKPRARANFGDRRICRLRRGSHR